MNRLPAASPVPTAAMRARGGREGGSELECWHLPRNTAAERLCSALRLGRGGRPKWRTRARAAGAAEMGTLRAMERLTERRPPSQQAGPGRDRDRGSAIWPSLPRWQFARKCGRRERRGCKAVHGQCRRSGSALRTYEAEY